MQWNDFVFEVLKNSQMPEADVMYKLDKENFSPGHIAPLGEAADQLEGCGNFAYDRASGIVLINMHSHGYLLEMLRHIYTGRCDEYYAADNYLAEGRGFYKSSVSSTVYKGVHTRLSFQERRVFSGFKFENVISEVTA